MGVVVITGASQGVGRATARAFAARGDDVALLARSPDGLAGAAHDVRAAGGRPLALEVDVADAGAVAGAAATVEEHFGPVDVWVNNAMAAVLAPVHETSAEEFRRITEVTYLGYVHGTLAVLPRMRARDRGVIVMVGSALAYRAIPLQATYCAAKHAIRGFSDSLRVELMAEGSGVKVTAVHLPGLNTPQFDSVKTTLRRHPQPMPPIFQPEVAADAIVHASDHPRREFFVTATTARTIAGNKLAPRVADRVLARGGIDGQQTDDPIAPDRPHYLDAPLPGDRGAHGRFDAEAKGASASWWLTKHRAKLAAGALGGAAAALATAAVRR